MKNKFRRPPVLIAIILILGLLIFGGVFVYQRFAKIAHPQTPVFQKGKNIDAIKIGNNLCGISIVKNWAENGGYTTDFLFEYNGIHYQTNENQKFKYDFSGGFDSSSPTEIIQADGGTVYDINYNHDPSLESGDRQFDLIFYSQEISKKDFETIASCIKSNINSVKNLFQVEKKERGELRAMIYTNRDPYVKDWYICDSNKLLTLNIYPGYSINNHSIDYLVGSIEKNTQGIFGYIINGKFYPDIFTQKPYNLPLTQGMISIAKDAFNDNSKCRDRSGQTLPISNSYEDFIKNPYPI